MGRRGPTLRQLGEGALLQQLQAALGAPARGVLLGVREADDAALLRPCRGRLVLTCDALVEGVDYEQAWATPGDVGHKAAAANLSDLAAMGATPRALVAALTAPPTASAAACLHLLRRIDAVGRHFGAPLVGGDLSATAGPLTVSVTALGEVTGGQVLRRRRGRPGDVVLVSGRLGGAGLGLALLQAGAPRRGRWQRRQLRPRPRVGLGQALARGPWVRAAADVSDGLVRDAAHLPGPGCGVRLDAAALPLEPAPGSPWSPWSPRHGPLHQALYGGEDFELLLAVAPRHVDAVQARGRACGCPCWPIGAITGRPGVTLRGPDGRTLRAAGGFEHFTGGRAAAGRRPTRPHF